MRTGNLAGPTPTPTALMAALRAVHRYGFRLDCLRRSRRVRYDPTVYAIIEEVLCVSL